MNCSARWAASPWHSSAQRFERDQALAALSEREARYRELFKANPQVMFVYEIRSLRFLAVNEAALAFYGYSREEMLDMALQDVEPPGIQAPRNRVQAALRPSGTSRCRARADIRTRTAISGWWNGSLRPRSLKAGRPN
jgi:PAS domain S-box-containing protein